MRIALRGRHTRVGNADDHIGLDRLLVRELTAHVIAARVDALAVHDAVGACEVHLLEYAVGTGLRGNALFGNQALGVDAQDLTRFDVANILGAYDVERARLGGNHPAARGDNRRILRG